MIVQLERVCAVLLLAVCFSVKAELKFENNAYKNVLVSFSPNVPSQNGQFLVESMQGLLENASQILHGAFQVRIADVTFHLPDTWDTSTWEPSIPLEPKSLETSDTNILVDGTRGSAFGKYPFTLQFGGCGVPGKPITVPMDFLNDTIDYPKGTLLAREWLKYRYGVFDENGYPGDARYPDYYTIPGNDEDVKVTECTDPAVEYNFRDSNGNNCYLAKDDKPGNDDCKIYPNETSAENVSSSLMYFNKDLRNMVHICGMDHHHNELSPSKHNILCGEKNVWEVVKESQELKSAGVGTAVYESVVFHYVQESKPRVSVLWENTATLHNEKDPVVFALRRLFYDLPQGSKASFYSFADVESGVTTVRSLSELPPKDQRDITIPSSFVSEVDSVCPTCALDKTLDELRDDGADKPASIILIVGSNSTEDSAVVEKLKTSSLCLTVLAIKKKDATVVGYESFISASNCNSMIEIAPDGEEPFTFQDIYEALISAVPFPPRDDVTSTVEVGIMSVSKIIKIPADSITTKFTLWMNKITESKAFICKKEDDTDVTLAQIVPYTAYSFDSENSPVTCRLKNVLSGEVLTQVQMTTLPGYYFTEDIWIYDNTTTEQQMPIVIYAKINFAHNPVSNARVIAKVTDPEGNIIENPLILYDNGGGDPDVTRNDGIYSRYFFRFSKEGKYEVTVKIVDNSGMARVLRNGSDHCCGSEVKALQTDTVPSFEKTLHASFDAKSGRPENGYPPMRIIDLRVERFEPPTSMVLKWTAPGGEVDSGKASSYEFRLFCDSGEICKVDGTFPAWITFNNSKPMPQEPGETEVAQLLFSNEAPTNLTVLIGIETVKLTHTSGISNRIQVRFPSAVDIVQPTDVVPENKQRDINYSSIGKAIGGVVIGILILFCIGGLVHFLLERRKTARRGMIDEFESRIENAHGVEKSNSFKAIDNIRKRSNSMRRVESFPVLLYTHDQIKDFKSKNKYSETPLFKANVAPKPWLSLGELHSGQSKADNDDKSGDSASTIHMNDVKSGSNEMRQLDDASSTSDTQTDKIAKF